MSKMAALQRVDRLVDPGSFRARQNAANSVAITGEALLDGRRVFIYATEHEPSGPPADMYLTLQDTIDIIEAAGRACCPMISLLDAPGHAHTSGGKTPLPSQSLLLHAHRRGAGRWYSSLARLSGQVPRVCALFGMTGAATVFPVALADVAVMKDDSGVCIGRPDAVRSMLGESSAYQELGGARMHCERSGLGDALVSSDQDALEWTRRYLSFFPSSRQGIPPRLPARPALDTGLTDDELVAADPSRPFDMHPLIESLVDQNSLLEIKALYGRSVITALARIEGRAAGIVASNSICQGGVLFPETCAKICRFLSICDAFGIPVIFLADTPGFMIGKAAEQSGIIKSAGMLFAGIANLTVPKQCIVVRNAHTAGLYAMSGPGFDPVEFLALPTAVITVFGSKAIERFAGDRELSDAARRSMSEMGELSRHPEILVDKNLLDGIVAIRDLRSRIDSFLIRAEGHKRENIRRPVQ